MTDHHNNARRAADHYLLFAVEFRAWTDGATATVWPRDRNAPVSISDADLLLLQSSTQPKTACEHALAYASAHQRDARSVLDRLLILESIGLLARLPAAGVEQFTSTTAATTERIAWLAIPTANRYSMLCRALRSYCANFQLVERAVNILVCEDYEPSAVPALHGCSPESPSNVRIYYISRQEKESYLELLHKRGKFPVDVLRFGLFGEGFRGPTMGANRNNILLQTAGELLLSVDDDTVCMPAKAPNTDTCGLRLVGETDATEFWFYPDRNTALSAAVRSRIDILGQHEALLGIPIRSAISHALRDGVLQVEQACPHFTPDAVMETGRTLLTINGVVGDSGMLSGDGLVLHTSPFTRARMDGSSDAFKRALTSREVIRQSPSRAICHGGPLMSTFLGIDNRALVPPFPPLYRNEDGVFGMLVSLCVPDSFVAQLPFAMLHAPTASRSYDRNRWGAFRVSDVFIAVTRQWYPARFGNASARLRCLGSFLMSVSSAREKDFMWCISRWLLDHAVEQLNYHEFLLERALDAPLYVVDERKRQIRCLRSHLRSNCVFPIDMLAAGYTSTEVPVALKTMLDHFGRLLYYWPDIVEVAKDVAAELPIARRSARWVC